VSELTDVGVVAIGRNEGERLRRCLASIPPRVPIVYVDSGSTDGSAELADSMGAKVIELDLSCPFTAARARNAGLEALLEIAPGTEFTQFVDGDCELEEGWLVHAAIFLRRNPEVAAACGRRRERKPKDSFYNRLCDEEWDTPVGAAMACGGDALMRTSALVAINGYDAQLVAGEEPEMCSRLRRQGWRIWRLDVPMTIHDAEMHLFRQWWRRSIRSGFGYAQVWHKTVRSGDPLYGRELGRAFIWAVGVPVFGIVAAVLWRWQALILIPVLWGLQLVRLGVRQGPLKGALLLLAKAAESLGAVRYAVQLTLHRQKKAIYYK
jgi:glycosyltransferase involved in cell wall biosynthesis